MLFMSFMVLVVAVFCLLWVGIRKNSVPLLVGIAFIALIYVGRGFMFLLGTPTIAPEFFLNVNELAAKANLLTATYLFAAFVSFFMWSKIGQFAGNVFFPIRMKSNSNRYFKLAATFLSCVSVVLILFLFSQYGTINEILVASKIEKSLKGTFVLRQFPGLGATFAIICFLEDAKTRGYSKSSLFWLAAIAVNFFTFYLWGSRLEMFVLAAAFLTSMIMLNSGRLKVKDLYKLSMLVVIFIAGATYMYVQRLYQLSGSWELVWGRDLPTTMAVSMHMSRVDAFMLVIQDFSSAPSLREGQDFFNGLLMSVPRAVWPDKPETLLIGQWFRQVYEPNAVNGWPVGAPGEYLLNFGIIGVVVGGALFGFILRTVDAGYRKLGSGTPMAIIISFIWMLIIVPEGSIIQIIPRIILWIIPIWLLIFLERISK